MIRTIKFKCSFHGLGQLGCLRSHVLLKFWLEYREWYCTYVMFLVIFRVPCLKLFWVSVWGYRIHEKVSSLSNYRLYADVKDYMIIRTIDPLLNHMHEFSLKIFYGGLCHLWLYFFNKIKVYWNVWLFDYMYFHSSFCIDTGWFVISKSY